MNTVFKYSLLHYVHSQVLDESLNIGILIFFPEHHKVVFRYSDRMNSFKYIYPTFSKQHIEAYLEGFTKRAKIITENYSSFSEQEFRTNPKEYINSEFLPEDATVLQFSKIYTSLLYSNDLNKIISNLCNTYFPDYNSGNKHDTYFSHRLVDESHIYHSGYQKHNDKYVLRAISSIIKNKNQDAVKFFKKKIEVKLDTSLVFDMAWQNGSTNLVKPVSFDLSNSTNIQRKANRLFGTLFFLSDEAEANNYRFDLLVAKPQNKTLFKAYDKALNKLEKIPSPKKIIEEEGFDDYIDKAISQLHIV